MKFHSGNEGFIRKYWRFFYIIPLLVVHYLTMGLHIAEVVAKGELVQVAYVLPPFFVSTQGIMKAIVLTPKMNILTTLIKELGDLWRTNGLTLTQQNAKEAIMKKVKLFNAVSYWVSLITALQYLTTPLLETLVRRFILHQDYEMQLAIGCSYPFDPTRNWLVYGAVTVFQTYSCLCMCVFIYIGPELIMITLCALLGVEFTLLSEDLLHVRPELKKKTKVNKEYIDKTSEGRFTLRDIIMRHQKLCILSNQLDEAFNQVVSIDLIFGGLITCFHRYAAQFSQGVIIMVIYYIAVVACLLLIFSMCYFGEVLSRASLHVGEMAYHNLWYKGDKHYQTTIFIIITRSQTPCCLTSMKYAPVTLKLFTKVMSSTWSYFSLMNNIYEDEM